MGNELGGFRRMSVLGLRTFHADVEGLEETRGVGFEEPDVEIVVMERRRLRRRMALHGPIERLPKKGRAVFHACGQGDEPLCPHELELVADGLVEEDLGAYG